MSRPYLDTLPTGYRSEQIILDWVEFLVTTAGLSEATQALDYYESMEWISEEVNRELTEYLDLCRGYDTTGTLTRDDHLKSLEFIESLLNTPLQGSPS